MQSEDHAKFLNFIKLVERKVTSGL